PADRHHPAPARADSRIRGCERRGSTARRRTAGVRTRRPGGPAGARGAGGLTITGPVTFLDSRRLTGPGLLLDGPGAILEIQLDDPERAAAMAAWRRAARRMLDAVGWSGETLATRTFAGGASLALSAPADALYAATDLNEWAWEAAAAEIHGAPEPDFSAAAERLRAVIQKEQCPALLALR